MLGIKTKHSNLMCIWYHNQNTADVVLRQVKIYLHKYFNCVRIFDNIKHLTAYLAGKLVIKRIVFIISRHDKTEMAAIQRLVQQRRQFQKLYKLQLEDHASLILPDIASLRSMLEIFFDKITNELPQTEELHCTEEDTIERTENVIDELPPLFDTFKSVSAQNSLCDLNTESLKFLLLQSLIEVLIRKSYEPNDLKYMWDLCRQDCINNPIEATNIKKIAAAYSSEKAIYYYTQNSCLFRLFNRAFRLEDIERIFRFGFYIADIHHQLEKKGSNQRLQQNQNIKTFFRGKKYSADVIQQFKDSIGHLISINGLLSTSENYDISTVFSGLDTKNSDCQSVIFEININFTSIDLIRPYAHIKDVSLYPDENEVLFFMGFVWKLESMTEMLSNMWYIELQSCTDYDPQLIQYIEESKRNCPYFTIGNILKELGDHTNAGNFYQRTLTEKSLSEEARGHLYFNMGMLADDQGEYLEALSYFQKAEECIKTTLTHSNNKLAPTRGLVACNTVPSRMCALYNLGRMYLKDGNYQLAEKNFEDALQLPESEVVEQATVLNNYGLLKFQRGCIEEAYDYIKQAVQLSQNDACCSEFKRNLDIILKHLPLQHTEATP